MEIQDECKKSRPRWFETCVEKNAKKYERILHDAFVGGREAMI